MVPEVGPRVVTLARKSSSPLRGNPEPGSPFRTTEKSLGRPRRFTRTRAVAGRPRP